MTTQRPVGEIVKAIQDDVALIARSEIELAKAELIPSAKNAGVGAGLFGGAGYFALNGVSLLFLAGAAGFGALFAMIIDNPWGAAALGLVAMALILLIIAGILALIGKGKVDKVKGPERTIANAELTRDRTKGAVQSGLAKVDAEVDSKPEIESAKTTLSTTEPTVPPATLR